MARDSSEWCTIDQGGLRCRDRPAMCTFIREPGCKRVSCSPTPATLPHRLAPHSPTSASQQRGCLRRRPTPAASSCFMSVCSMLNPGSRCPRGCLLFPHIATVAVAVPVDRAPGRRSKTAWPREVSMVVRHPHCLLERACLGPCRLLERG